MSNDNSEWEKVGGDAKLDMWDEQADKTIVGKYVKIRKNVGKNNSNIYELEMPDGSTKGVWGSTVLDGRFENIAVGSMVKIEYIGKTPGKDARGAYKNYEVFMKPASSAPSTSKPVGTDSDIPF